MSAIPHLKLLLPGLLLNVSISPPAHGSNAASGSFQSS